MASFRTTAAFYSRYRVPYPDSLVTRLKADANVGRDSSVLDVATGPGRLALALAPSVREVVAVDAESEMLNEGRRIGTMELAAHGTMAVAHDVHWPVGFECDVCAQTASGQHGFFAVYIKENGTARDAGSE